MGDLKGRVARDLPQPSELNPLNGGGSSPGREKAARRGAKKSREENPGSGASGGPRARTTRKKKGNGTRGGLGRGLTGCAMKMKASRSVRDLNALGVKTCTD